MAIQLVLLDFDGTLVDTAPDLIRAANRFLRQHGRQELPEKKIRDQIGFGLWPLVQGFFPEVDESRRTELQNGFLAVYEEEMLNSPDFFPGALDFLKSWKGRFAIVSNKRSKLIHKLLEHLDIHQLPWSAVIGGDTLAQMKPHPMPFLEAIKSAGARHDETVMVGDGLPDIEGARVTGIRSVAVSFGYSPLQQLLQLGAHATISDFAELPNILKGFEGTKK